MDSIFHGWRREEATDVEEQEHVGDLPAQDTQLKHELALWDYSLKVAEGQSVGDELPFWPIHSPATEQSIVQRDQHRIDLMKRLLAEEDSNFASIERLMSYSPVPRDADGFMLNTEGFCCFFSSPTVTDGIAAQILDNDDKYTYRCVNGFTMDLSSGTVGLLVEYSFAGNGIPSPRQPYSGCRLLRILTCQVSLGWQT